MHWLQVDHATARDCRRRGNLQVVDLKHHRTGVWHADSLTIVKAQHFVVIKYSVHVLDPESIDGAIEADPALPVGLLALHLLDGIFDELAHNTFLPLISEDVSLTEEFAHPDGLRVQSPDLDGFVPVIFVAIIVKLMERLAEDVSASGLSSACGTNKHVTVPDSHSLEQLDDLCVELGHNLVILLCELVSDR